MEEFFTWYKAFDVLNKIPLLSKNDFEKYSFLIEDVKYQDHGRQHHEGFQASSEDKHFSLLHMGPCLLKGEYFTIWSTLYPDTYHGNAEEIIEEFNKKHSGEFSDLPKIQIDSFADISDLEDEYEYKWEDWHEDCNDGDEIVITLRNLQVQNWYADTVEMHGSSCFSDRFHWYYPVYDSVPFGKQISDKSLIAIIIANIQQYLKSPIREKCKSESNTILDQLFTA